jgi:hypothetical protein
MSYQAEVYNVMIASPSDVSLERQIARDIILDWNNINSGIRKIVLFPISWEYNSIPSMGNRPQEIINEQILRNADILVGIFWTRIGTPTGKAISGTVEEIEEHIESGKPAMLYFSNKPVMPDSINTKQYNAVKKLKDEFQSKGLTNDFDSVDDFRKNFQRHLSMKFNESKYHTDQIESNAESNFDTTEIRYNLSNEAKIILTEVSKDNAGQIFKLTSLGGWSFLTNGNQLNDDYSPRTKAKLEAAITELLELDLINDVEYKGEIFQLTDKGYQVADKLS